MTKKTYSEKLLDPRWQRKRLEVMSRDNFACTLCGDAKNTLHVHHIEYKKNAPPWDYEIDNFKTVCKDCHLIYEDRKNMGVHLLKAKTIGSFDEYAKNVAVYVYEERNNEYCIYLFVIDYILNLAEYKFRFLSSEAIEINNLIIDTNP